MKLCLIENRGEKAWSFDIIGEAITIGRSNENDIRVHDRYVSHRHLILWKRENEFFLKNLGNKNGTRVNGFSIPSGATVEVRRGDTIEIGLSILCIGEGTSGDMFAFLESLDAHKQGENDTSTAVLEDTVYNFL
ncbi:MAG: FHA domain-containing protein [Deltaproteobacteria bacterium]|nr:FHA domain-containing protein [Deltaproteobacteria bacterium]